jgi:CBS domain-containing protein
VENALVRDIMTTNVLSIDPDLGVDTAVELMRSNSVRRLPVVSDSGRLIGIITLEDARLALPKDLRDEHGYNREAPPAVREVMTDYVYTTQPEEPLGVAARRMVNHRVGALPVLEDRRLVGVVTESDIFRFVAEQYEQQHPEAAEGS